jgi:hypothetical protein
MYNAEDMKSYAAHVENMYPRQSADRKRLIVHLMQELSPEREYTGEAKPNAKTPYDLTSFPILVTVRI